MTTRTLLLIAPFPAAFVAWMLSGSPLPMLLTAVASVVAFSGSQLLRFESLSYWLRILFPTFAIGLVFLEVWMFRTGLAMAVNADLPMWYHLALGCLWGIGLEVLRFRNGVPLLLYFAGCGSCLILLGATYAVELYDFSPWQVYPIAAVPLLLLLFSKLMEGTSALRKVVLTALTSLVITSVALGLREGTDSVGDWIREKDASPGDFSSSERPQLDSGTGGPDGSSRRLPRKANIRFNDRIRMYLQTESSELFANWMRKPLYLRTSTVSVFESDEVIAPVRSARWLDDEDDGETDFLIPIKTNQPSLARDYTLFIQSRAAHALPLLAGTSSVRTSTLYEFADDWYQLAPKEGIKQLRYTAGIALDSPPILGDVDLEELRRPDAPGIYLNLPPSPLAARVTGLCQRLPDNATTGTIRDLLQERTTYSLEYETPEGVSPVENLLFGQRLGHCELYAAATCMMLRAIGIPSRVTYGYSGGMADRDRQLVAFRDRDFHAWTEVLTPENRWAIFDTTPVSSESARRNPSATSLPAYDLSAYENYSDSTYQAPRGRMAVISLLGDFTAFLSRHFAALTVVILVCFGGAGWLRSRRGYSQSNPGSQSDAPFTATHSIALLEELEKCSRLLPEGKAEGQTWKEYLSRLQDGDALPPVFEEAIHYCYLIRYAGRKADPSKEAALGDALALWRQGRLTN